MSVSSSHTRSSHHTRIAGYDTHTRHLVPPHWRGSMRAEKANKNSKSPLAIISDASHRTAPQQCTAEGCCVAHQQCSGVRAHGGSHNTEVAEYARARKAGSSMPHRERGQRTSATGRSKTGSMGGRQQQPAGRRLHSRPGAAPCALQSVHYSVLRANPSAQRLVRNRN